MLFKPIMILLKHLCSRDSLFIIDLEEIFNKLADLPRITVVDIGWLCLFLGSLPILVDLLVQVSGLGFPALAQHIVYLLQIVAITKTVRYPAFVVRGCTRRRYQGFRVYL